MKGARRLTSIIIAGSGCSPMSRRSEFELVSHTQACTRFFFPPRFSPAVGGRLRRNRFMSLSPSLSSSKSTRPMSFADPQSSLAPESSRSPSLSRAASLERMSRRSRTIGVGTTQKPHSSWEQQNRKSCTRLRLASVRSVAWRSGTQAGEWHTYKQAGG